MDRTLLDFVRTLILSYIIFVTSFAQAQEWRSALYPEDWVPPEERVEEVDFLTDSFVQDFSYAGYHNGEKALPNSTDGLVNVVETYGADSTGATDSTLAIQAAINAVQFAGGGTVYLPEGTYRVSRRAGEDYCLLISESNVVLRGSGVESSFILSTSYEMNHAEVIRVRALDSGSWRIKRSSPVSVAVDYAGPTKSLEVLDSSGFSVGDWVVVLNPVTEAFVQELNMGNGSDGVSWLDDIPDLQGPRWLRRVLAIDKYTLMLDAPLRWAVNTRDGAVVYKATSNLLEEVGLEDFSIGNSAHPGIEWGEEDYTVSGNAAYDTHDSWLISFSGVINSWVRNVSSYGALDASTGLGQSVHFLSNGVLLRYSRGVTLYNVSMTNSQYGGGGGNGYCIRFNEANECMVAGSEVGFSRHGIVQWRMENSGNVFLGNYDHDTGFQWGAGTPSETSGRGSDHHGKFSFSNLFDSNVVERSYMEAAYRGDWGNDHGMTSSQTVFWNTQGKEYLGSGNFIVHTQQFGQGYVIGTSGMADGVRTTEKRPDSAWRTGPVDWVEGVSVGDALLPGSLYISQFLLRMENLGGVVNYSILKKGDELVLKWNLPPGLKCGLDVSEDLSVWEPYLDIPTANGEHSSNLSMLNFSKLPGVSIPDSLNEKHSAR